MNQGEIEKMDDLQHHLPPGNRADLVVIPRAVLSLAVCSIAALSLGAGVSLGGAKVMAPLAPYGVMIGFAISLLLGWRLTRIERRFLRKSSFTKSEDQ
jgi:fructose-specific phosphotransferase system IIC component